MCIVIPFSVAKSYVLYTHIIRYKTWSYINRKKKHVAVDHCSNVPDNINAFCGEVQVVFIRSLFSLFDFSHIMVHL